MSEQSGGNRPEFRDDQGIIPSFGPAKVDECGRLLPISDEERDGRAEAVRRLFALWETEADDDPPGIWGEFTRNIDDERTRQGMRTLFDDRR